MPRVYLDRASVITAAIQLIAPKLEPGELDQIETCLRDEIADLALQIAADRGDITQPWEDHPNGA